MPRARQSLKPIIFISHVHEDERIAAALCAWIELELRGGVDCFRSTDREDLRPGTDWPQVLRQKLLNSVISLHIISPRSIGRPWIHFEAGAAYGRGISVLPICVEGVSIRDLLYLPLSLCMALQLPDPKAERDLMDEVARCVGLLIPATLLTRPRLPEMMIRVLVADHRDMQREGMLAMLGRGDDIDLVDNAATINEVLEKTTRTRPEILLLDLNWGDDEHAGIDVIRQLGEQAPDSKIVAISQEGELRAQAMEAGAVAFLTKDISQDDLIRTMRDLHVE